MSKSRKPKLPRVPLPRQVGGAHIDKRKRPPKHKKRDPFDPLNWRDAP